MTAQQRARPRRLKGFRDITARDLIARDRMIARIREVYERYGFTPLETPMLEYVEVLGKFLPEANRPDAGIFALRDEDDEWIALRYDLTAPLARYVAMNPDLPRPFRRYQVGPVFRLEKPGPGRFREFYQFDVDTVGTSSMLADAECCMIMCDTLEALGIARGHYLIKVNNRKVLSGVLQTIADREPLSSQAQLTVLRAIDKLDRVGLDGVRQLLDQGRRDESGDFTPGANLSPRQIDLLLRYLSLAESSRTRLCDALANLVAGSEIGSKGVAELREIDEYLSNQQYADDRVLFDPTVVRGLAYYTGPVFEGVLTFPIVDEQGITRPFGSVFGGGRYDDLVARFTGQKIPATGTSIGVDRLLAALAALGRTDSPSTGAAVLVTRLDKNLTPEYQCIVQELRAAGINAELYVGTQGIGKQFKYASDTGKIAAIVLGEEEHARGEVGVKDLRLGEELSRNLGPDRRQWLENQPAQLTVPRAALLQTLRTIFARYSA